MLLALLLSGVPAVSEAQQSSPSPSAAGHRQRSNRSSTSITPATAAERLLAAPISVPGERWSLEQTICSPSTECGGPRGRGQDAAGERGPRSPGGAASSRTFPRGADYTYSKPARTAPLSSTTIDTTEVIGFLEHGSDLGASARASTVEIISLPAIGEKQRARSRARERGARRVRDAEQHRVPAVKRQYFAVLKAERLALVAR
jgi:hypothetical protein